MVAWDMLSCAQVCFRLEVVKASTNHSLRAVNMTNVLLYRRASHPIQSGGCVLVSKSLLWDSCGPYSVSLAYAFVWIMSQRILIHVRGVYPTTIRSLH